MGQRYKVIRAGHLVHTITYTAIAPRDEPRARKAKTQLSTEARRRLNYEGSRVKLELLIAANFTFDDYFVTLTFADEHLPKSFKEAGERAKAFNRRMRDSRRHRGEAYRYVYAVEDGRGLGRFHIHAVISAGSLGDEEIRSLWPWGEIVKVDTIHRDDNDWCRGVARYITKEDTATTPRPLDMRAWIPSLGLKRPVVEVGYLTDGQELVPPRSANIIKKATEQNEWGSYYYCRYTLSSDTPPEKGLPFKAFPSSRLTIYEPPAAPPEVRQRR